MSADTRTDPPTPDPLTAIRRRNSDWQSGEFDGVHEHPDTQCSADIDREWLLASLDAASEPDLECLECGGRIGLSEATTSPEATLDGEMEWLDPRHRQWSRGNIARHPDARFPYKAILPLIDALDTLAARLRGPA